MDIRMILLQTSNILVFVAYLVYIVSILLKKARPHRTTRLVLLLITALAALSLRAQGDQVAVWLAGISAAMSAVVFLLSLKRGMGGWAKLDVICLLMALAGIILWQVTDRPLVALLAAIAADFTGVVPTIVKTYHRPDTEVWTFFALGGTGALFNLLAVRSWTVAEVSYPLYLTTVGMALAALTLRRGAGRKDRFLPTQINS